MSEIFDIHRLTIASKILETKLLDRALFDIRILDPSIVSGPKDFEEFDGRFVCFFALKSPTEPYFVVTCRRAPLGPITHVYVYYANKQCRSILDPERTWLENRLPKVIVKRSMSVVFQDPQFCSLAALIQAAQFTINFDLFHRRFKHCTISVKHGSSFLRTSYQFTDYPSCDLKSHDPAASDLFDLARKAGFMFKNFVSGKKFSPDTNILRIPAQDGHCLYGIYYQQVNSMMVLIPHSRQIATKQLVGSLLELLKSSVEGPPMKYVGSCRYGSAPDVHCNSVELLKACILLSLFPAFELSPKDIDTLVCTSDLVDLKRSLTFRLACHEPLLEPRRSSSDQHDDTFSPGDDDEPIDVVELSDANSQVARCSQASIGSVAAEVGSELNSYVEPLKYFVKMDIPEIMHLKPSDLYSIDLLESMEFYRMCIDRITQRWLDVGGVSVKVHNTADLGQNNVQKLNKGVRFNVYPFEYNSRQLIVIADNKNEEYIWLNPDNDACKDEEVYLSQSNLIEKRIADLRMWSCAAVFMTSHFHKQYTKIHLLFGLFTMGRAFRYAVMLPQKVIYSEKPFRDWCYRVCLKQQLVNQEYNLVNDLINGDRSLRTGAFRSGSSPVVFERPSVSPTNQCYFCKSRSFTNLGSHMKMAHGNQARVIREIRKRKEAAS